MPKILIVDDDRTTVRLLTTLLELDGFLVTVAARGADVLPQAEEQRPDLVLIDYHLSDMEGVVAVRALREKPEFAALPIVMASGLNVEKEALAAGATTFIIKPFDPGALSPLFRELINGYD